MKRVFLPLICGLLALSLSACATVTGAPPAPATLAKVDKAVYLGELAIVAGGALGEAALLSPDAPKPELARGGDLLGRACATVYAARAAKTLGVGSPESQAFAAIGLVAQAQAVVAPHQATDGEAAEGLSMALLTAALYASPVFIELAAEARQVMTSEDAGFIAERLAALQGRTDAVCAGTPPRLLAAGA